MAKTRMDAERALAWVYRDEIPKLRLAVGAESNWDEIEEYLQHGGVSVQWSPNPQRYAHVGPPHPDAVMLDKLVSEMPVLQPASVDALRAVLGHLAPYLAEEGEEVPVRPVYGAALVHARRAAPVRALPPDAPESIKAKPSKLSVPALLQRHAKLGTRPNWDPGPIRLRRVMGGNNKPMLVGKINRTAHYQEGSYMPAVLEPSARKIAERRYEYVMWHRALTELAQSSWMLSQIELTPPAAPSFPWIDNLEITPRVLPSLDSGEGPLVIDKSQVSVRGRARATSRNTSRSVTTATFSPEAT